MIHHHVTRTHTRIHTEIVSSNRAREVDSRRVRKRVVNRLVEKTQKEKIGKEEDDKSKPGVET